MRNWVRIMMASISSALPPFLAWLSSLLTPCLFLACLCFPSGWQPPQASFSSLPLISPLQLVGTTATLPEVSDGLPIDFYFLPSWRYGRAAGKGLPGHAQEEGKQRDNSVWANPSILQKPSSCPPTPSALTFVFLYACRLVPTSPLPSTIPLLPN